MATEWREGDTGARWVIRNLIERRSVGDLRKYANTMYACDLGETYEELWEDEVSKAGPAQRDFWRKVGSSRD